MRSTALVLLLVPALLAAGCTKPEQPGAQLDPASTTPTPGGAPPTTSPPPATSPPPSSTPPPATSTPPPPPDTSVPPPRRDPYHTEASGWVQLQPPAPPATDPSFRATLSFPIYEGVANATIRVEVVSTYPQLGRLPRETANITLTLLDPDGKAIAVGGRMPTDESAAAVIALDGAAFTRFGEHTLVMRITGHSDGSTAGDKFFAAVDVYY